MNSHVMEVVDPYDAGLTSCRGCRAPGTFSESPSGACPTPYKSPEQLLAESLARESALQERLNVTDQRVDDLQAEVEALRKNAERYQFIRDAGGLVWTVIETQKNATGVVYDQCIDDAMSKVRPA